MEVYADTLVMLAPGVNTGSAVTVRFACQNGDWPGCALAISDADGLVVAVHDSGASPITSLALDGLGFSARIGDTYGPKYVEEDDPDFSCGAEVRTRLACFEGDTSATLEMHEPGTFKVSGQTLQAVALDTTKWDFPPDLCSDMINFDNFAWEVWRSD